MRRGERERIARRQTLLASKSNYWTPKGMTLDEYLKAVNEHPPITEILDYLERHRAWEPGDEFDFAKSHNGVCEKCAVREVEKDLSTEFKAAPKFLNGSTDVEFSRVAAEHFATRKEPIVLTPNLHRDFVYHSWVEAAHLEHIKEHRDDPGIAALEAHPEIEADGTQSLALGIRAVDGSHRAALAYKEGRPFAVRVLSPVETLKSLFAINNQKNPFFALKYSPRDEEVLVLMALGRIKNA
jgi:hypothetical protein